MILNNTGSLTTQEITFLRSLLESITNDNIKEFSFSENKIKEFTKNKVFLDAFNLLFSKQILTISTLNVCSICNLQEDFCSCSEKTINKFKYYNLNLNQLYVYILSSIKDLYDASIEEIKELDDEINFMLKGKNYEIKIHIYISKLSKEFLQSLSKTKELHITILPLAYFIDNLSNNIYEWHQFMQEDEILKIKRQILEQKMNVKSKEIYFLDLGDDLEVRQVEIIRDIFKEFLVKKGFVISEYSQFRE